MTGTSFRYGKNRLLAEITPDDLRGLCEKVKARGAPATAIHVRDIVKQIYGFAKLNGQKVANPADEVGPASIATFVPKDRALTPSEIRIVFELLEKIATLPTIRLALRLVVLTMVRKSELLDATWNEVDFERAVWSIPKERMKRRKPHNVYLSRQSLDIFIALRTCAGNSRYVLPSRYDADAPMSRATLNRVTMGILERAQAAKLPLDTFTVHDLRRTGSTLLHEAGFNTDWIEKCLAHEDNRGSRGVYNKAEYELQRRHMLQEWADMIDAWVEGTSKIPILQPPRTEAGSLEKVGLERFVISPRIGTVSLHLSALSPCSIFSFSPGSALSRWFTEGEYQMTRSEHGPLPTPEPDIALPPQAPLLKSKRHWFAPEGDRILRQTIRRSELHKMVPLGATTIWEMEQRGDFPKRFYLAPRCVAWDLAEVEAWLDQRKQATQAEGIQMDEWPRVRRRDTRAKHVDRH